ncbi:MAG: cytochrome b5 domain-containing protein [Desulfobacterales bacterium]|jgi:predicted heme/steroid binding protein/uncharacterized membrane protein
MQEFDIAELEKYDGSDGRPVYVAYKGKVYDISGSKLWRNGIHMKRHHAGRNLTTDIQGAPHEPDVLERFPQVGTLKKETAEVAELEIPRALNWLLQKVPMLRRHPHPMTVHFPIAFVFATAVFNILYLLTDYRSFEITALHCLAGGILFTIVGITTGLYTWWLNYMAKPLRAVKIKIPLTITLLIIQIILFVWRISVPDVFDSIQGINILYLIFVLALIPMITIIGWFGASMTFPVEKS